MNEIKHFMLPEHTNNLYKNEAISSISLTKEVADKINELVDAINNREDIDLKWKHEIEGKLHKGVIFMKDNLLNSLHDLLELYKEDETIKNMILEIFGEFNVEKFGYVTLSELGVENNGVTDVSDIINEAIEKYPVIDLTGKSYVIRKTLNVKNCTIQNGVLLYDGYIDKDIILMLSNSGLKNVKIIVNKNGFKGNVIHIDYTEITEQWVKETVVIDGIEIDNTINDSFVNGSTAVRINYDKYQVITQQHINNLRLYGRIDYGFYIEPLLRDEKDNPVYNTTTFSNIFFYSANCPLKVLPKMTTGNIENARGEVGLFLSNFANQNVNGISKPFFDLHNTNIAGDMVIPWDYYGDRIPSSGMYKLHKSDVILSKDYMPVATADNDNVLFAYKELSTGERFTNIHAVKPLNVANANPVRNSGVAWAVDNIKSVVFKPEINNDYNNEYIGFELQRDNKSVAKNKTVQIGVSSSGTLVWRQYTDGEGWSDLRQIYSEGKIKTSYAGKRPDGVAVGDMKFDTTLKCPVWWNGEAWCKADGTTI